jgi:uncharacterized protein (TIGR02117 family)
MKRGTRTWGVVLLLGRIALVLTLTVGAIIGFFALDPPFWPSPAVQVYTAESRSSASTHDHSIYLVKHSFHTSISVRAADLDAATWPDPGALTKSWVDVSWGDSVYFRAPEGTLAMALDALLLPGPAVLHVATFDASPETYFAQETVIRLPISSAGLRRLSAYLRDSYTLDASGKPVLLQPGYYGEESRFLGATGVYSLPYTCNVWTGHALQAAGLPVTPQFAITAENLAAQASRLRAP